MTNIFSDLLPTKKEEKLQKPNIFSNLLTSKKEEEENPNQNIMRNDSITDESLENNSKVREIALRFARDRNKLTDISEEDAYDNFIEHFRKFNVNEFTAGADWNYISAASADSTQDERAKQRLEDYTFLYKKFHSLPNWYGGVGKTLGDYAEGIAKAPSTIAGIFLPGFGKAAGIGASAISKAAVHKTVSKIAKDSMAKKLGSKLLPTNIVAAAAQRPIVTGMAIEGTAGGLLDVARQNVEMEIDVRDKYNVAETGIGIGAGMAAPAFLGAIGTRMAAGKAVSKLGKGSTIDDALVEKIDKSIMKKINTANKEADKTLASIANKTLSKKIKSNLPELNPDLVKQGYQGFEAIALQDAINPDLAVRLDGDRTKRVWAMVTELISNNSKIKTAFEKNVKNADGTWKVRATEAMADVLRTTKGTEEAKKLMGGLYKKYNLTGDDMANLFLAQWSQAGKELQTASFMKQNLMGKLDESVADIFGMDKSLRESIDKLNKSIDNDDVRGFLDHLSGAQGIARQLDQVRLAAMTSQTATTFRNTVSGYNRIGMDTVVNIFDRSLVTAAKSMGFAKNKVGLFDGKPNDDVWSLVFGLSNKRETSLISDVFKLNFNKQAQTLFRELRDIADATGSTSNKLTAARTIGRQLNALNTLSDNYFKRIAFISNIKKQLNQTYTSTVNNLDKISNIRGKYKSIKEFEKAHKGLLKDIPHTFITDKIRKGIKITDADKKLLMKDFDLLEMVKADKFSSYFGTNAGKKILDKSIKDSLYFTYQATPPGALGKSFVSIMNSVPFVTTSFVPFPRFIANAMRFTYEYSPLYLAQGGYRSFVKNADDYQEVAKALTGLAGYAGAYMFRDSEYAGENWWEGKLPNGETFDMRPFFPASPFLYFADLGLRYMKGDPVLDDKYFLRNSAQALTGTQFRAGMGLYLLEDSLSDIFDSNKPLDEKYDALGELGIRVGANLINTFTIPITPVKDVYDTFIADDDKRLIYETKSSNTWDLFWNKSLSRIPAFMYDRTEFQDVKESPLRDAPYRRKIPLTRQTYGILLQDGKNELEKELARLKISKNIINQNTGVPEADTLINKFIGEWSSEILVPLLKADYYKNLENDALKISYIQGKVSEWKQDIKASVKFKAANKKANEDWKEEESVKKYGFNPLKKDAVQDKFSGKSQIFLEQAKEAYHKQYGKPKDGLSYDWDKLEAFANYLKGKFKLEASKN